MKVTLKKIAELANVSRGTVDRVIHNRPGVDEQVRERVLYILKELDYRPNLAGKALSSQGKYVLGVILAPDFNPFVDMVKQGVADSSKAINAFGFNTDIEVVSTFNVDEQLQILNHFEEIGVSGISIVPVNDKKIADKINELTDKGIPIVTFNSDIQNSKRLCFVGQDNYKAGRTAAALLEGLLADNEQILIITSSKALICHMNRINGCIDRIKESKKKLEVMDIIENEDVDDKTFDILVNYIQKNPSLNGIYLTGGGARGLGKALKVLGKTDVHVVCHDFVEPVISLMKEGVINFTIGQDPYKQGYLPLQILFDHIIKNVELERDVFYTGIDIRLAENIE